MADFVAVTSSSGVRVTDREKVQALLERFHTEPAGEWTDDLFGFWDYEWFAVYPMVEIGGEKEPDYDADATDEFLKELAQFIPEGERLVIQSVGHEKCRFPLGGQSIVVTPGGVEYYTLPE
jgi:hypothetical protein